MSRKMMTKEITKTTVRVSKIELVEGAPKVVNLPDEILLGNVNLENAQKQLNKKYDSQVTVLEVIPNTEVYELPVEKFLEIATIRKEQAPVVVAGE